MKKVMIALLAGVLFVPAFAGDKTDVKQPEKNNSVVAAEAKVKKGDFKKARKEQMEKMKATQEKAEKLVKEYNKAKGKKKEAKKAEIEAFVKSVRDEQLNFKEDQLVKFSQRLEHMKTALAEEKAHNSEWVAEKTEAFIAEEGSLKVLFDKPEGPRPGDNPKPDFKQGPKGHRPGHFGGPRGNTPRPPFEGNGPEEMPQPMPAK